jgi:hypothetical protein
MSEVIFQQPNTLGELFIVRKDGDKREFSVKVNSNGEINLGFLDTKQNCYQIWRGNRHIIVKDDVPYFGINKKVVFESKSLKGIEIETEGEGTFLIVPKELPKDQVIVENNGSFLDQFYVPISYIFSQETAPF